MAKKISLLLGLLLAGFSPNLLASDALFKAQQCTQIGQNRQRLACFDRIFNTANAQGLSRLQGQMTKANQYPRQYRIAMANEAERGKESGFFLGMSDPGGPHEQLIPDVWVTATAIGAKPPRPVLMLSCSDAISRVELMLPDGLEAGRADIEILVDGKQRIGQRWSSDDTGYILRSGRGVAAFSAMREMLNGKTMMLRSTNVLLDGLQFDVRGLEEAILPVRKACQW